MNLSQLFLIALTVLAISGYANSDPEPRNDHAVRKRQEVLQARRRQADIAHKDDLKRKIADFKARRRQKELEEAMKRRVALRQQRLGKSRTDQKPMGRRRASPRRLRGRYPAKKRSPSTFAKRKNSGGLGRRRQGGLGRRRQGGKLAEEERFLPMPFVRKRLNPSRTRERPK